MTVARVLGIPDEISIRALNNFKGTWRRMEYRGMVNGAKIYDDYGHHPTEIKATLQGAIELLSSSRVPRSGAWRSRGNAMGLLRRRSVPPRNDRRLWLVFQPHQYQRTHKLFNQFITAFNNADKVIILPIFSVPGREKDSIKKKVSSEMLAQEITNNQYEQVPRKREPISNKSKVKYIDTFQKAKNYLKKHLKKGDITVIMGAGDVYKLTEILLK